MKRLKLTTTSKIKPYVNCLVYGDAGAGKTHLCKTAPDPLIISVEGGMLTLKDDNLPVFEVANRNDVNEVYTWLKRSKEADKYQTICIDSISEIAELLLSEEKKATKDPRQAYGAMADLMSTTIREFRDLKKHTYFSAKVRKIVEESTGRTSFMPSVPGQTLLNDLPYFFDELFYLDIGVTKDAAKNKYRFLQTEKDTKRVAKDRSGELLPKEKPDLSYIINKIIKPKKGK